MEFEIIKQFHFLRPLFLWLLVPVLVFIYINWRSTEKQQDWMNVLPAHLVSVLRVGESGWSKQLPLKLGLLACFIFIFIIAGPAWHKQASPFGEDAANMIIVVDVSESMLQKDVAPNRLLRAKQKILDILDLRKTGQTGLIVFSGSAHIAMPLTKDQQVFSPLLESISPKVMPREGKFAQYTVPLIENMLKEITSPSTILLLTDGVNEASSMAFSNYLSNSPNQLLILGIGNEKVQADIPYEYQTLKKLASDTGGAFRSISADNDDVEWVVKKAEYNMLISADNTMPWVDSGYPLTFLVALVFLSWFRKGFLVKWCLIIGFTSISMAPAPVQAAQWNFMDLWLTADQQGQLLFEKQQYSEAANTFETTSWKAASYYLAGEYDLAQNYFLREDSLSAKFGAAAALAHQREYVAARAMYQEIVSADPEFPGAQQNAELMQSIIDQIDQFSESQSNNNEDLSSKELGDEPQTSEGSETQVSQEQLIEETLSSEDIMNNEELSEKWMKRVESNLETFLGSKFYYQLEDGNATMEYSSDDKALSE
ncbi:VWA domain-containing protein [Alginatibacterium sediminis]|uniref:VWA domain-containing protein n=1 Tax=Alginatibacterium sediminis TaxID=2164068 RepID=A0A420EHZ5_9ALTE|nr:VWA domain-containing protein [Alginatibacterium sediminis]RKF20361.1 VWA domain-containing protein [Alginatibacterium sediminis]